MPDCRAAARKVPFSAAGDTKERYGETGTEVKKRDGGKGWNSVREETTEIAERSGEEAERLVSRKGEIAEETGRQCGEKAGRDAAGNVFAEEFFSFPAGGRKDSRGSGMICLAGRSENGRRILSGSGRLSAVSRKGRPAIATGAARPVKGPGMRSTGMGA